MSEGARDDPTELLILVMGTIAAYVLALLCLEDTDTRLQEDYYEE